MAQTYSKPGQYPKSEAIRRWRRQLALVLTCVAIGFTLTGILFGLDLALPILRHLPTRLWPWMPWGAVFIALLTIGAAKIVTKRVGLTLEQLGKERLQYMRGGQAEALVSWHLSHLSDDWHLFNGLKLEADWDIDHVLVGPGGFYCLSTKAHRGTYSLATNGSYNLNGEPTDHIRRVVQQTMQLCDRLSALQGTVPWIQPVLVAPLAYIDFQSYQPKAWILHGDNLTDTLQKQSQSKLSSTEIVRCAKTLRLLAEGAQDIHRRPA